MGFWIWWVVLIFVVLRLVVINCSGLLFLFVGCLFFGGGLSLLQCRQQIELVLVLSMKLVMWVKFIGLLVNRVQKLFVSGWCIFSLQLLVLNLNVRQLLFGRLLISLLLRKIFGVLSFLFVYWFCGWQRQMVVWLVLVFGWVMKVGLFIVLKNVLGVLQLIRFVMIDRVSDRLCSMFYFFFYGYLCSIISWVGFVIC